MPLAIVVSYEGNMKNIINKAGVKPADLIRTLCGFQITIFITFYIPKLRNSTKAAALFASSFHPNKPICKQFL